MTVSYNNQVIIAVRMMYISHTAITFGFERSFYTTNEERGMLRNVISLGKQDNRTTERSFLINIRAVDASPPGTSVATLDDDYAVASTPGQRNILVQFNSFQDSLPILVGVFSDSVAEVPEAFQLQSAPNQVGPVFTAPDEATVYSCAFVQILNNGSKYNCSIDLKFRTIIAAYVNEHILSLFYAAGCVVPASPMNGDWQMFSPSEVVTPGTSISHSCNPAYQPSGMTSSTCQSYGSWDPDTAELTCVEGIVGTCIFILYNIRIQYTVCVYMCLHAIVT